MDQISLGATCGTFPGWWVSCPTQGSGSLKNVRRVSVGVSYRLNASTLSSDRSGGAHSLLWVGLGGTCLKSHDRGMKRHPPGLARQWGVCRQFPARK